MTSSATTTGPLVASSSSLPDYTYWVRANLAVEICLKDALLYVLHNSGNDRSYVGLPDDESQLYQHMLAFQKKYRKQLSRVVKPFQWQILCPSSGKSNSKDWDITSIVIVIRYCNNITKPIAGWDSDPSKNDSSVAAFVIRARKLRNDLKHGSLKDVETTVQFTALWKRIELILVGLGYINMTLFQDLESGSLKLYTSKTLILLENKLADIEQNKVDDNAKSIQQHSKKITAVESEMQTHDVALGIVDDNINKMVQRIATLESSFGLQREEICNLSEVKREIEDLTYELAELKENFKKSEHSKPLDLIKKNDGSSIAKDAEYDGNTPLSDELCSLVVSKIHIDWNQLAKKLKISATGSFRKLDTKRKIHALKKKPLSWHELRKILFEIKRGDIVSEISQKFILPTGLEHFQQCQRDYMVYSHGCDEVVAAAQLIPSFNQNNIDEIYYLNCGRTIATMDSQEWESRCEEYFNRYFDSHEKLIIPPLKFKSIYTSVATKFLDCFDEKDGKIYFFPHYDLLRHARFHVSKKDKYEMLLEKLSIASGEELQLSENRMLFLHSQLSLVMNIRITMENSEEEVAKEEEKGRSDIKLLLYINNSFVKESQVSFVNVVIAPNFSGNCCKECLVIDQNTLESRMKNWMSRLTKSIPSPSSKKQINFMNIIKSVFGFLGTMMFSSEDFGLFPKLNDCLKRGLEHIEIVNLFLTWEQANVAYDPSLKKIVLGGFGAGKSILGLLQLHEITRKEAQTNNHVFYILWDDKSLLQLQMKAVVEAVRSKSPNKNFHACNRVELSQKYLNTRKVPGISDIMKEIQKHCKTTTHFIFEEFDLKDFSDEESKNLAEMFKQEEWKESIVMLLPQVLENDHTVIINKVSQAKINRPNIYYAGMEVFSLNKHMRSTELIFKFNTIAAEVATSRVTNSFVLPKADMFWSKNHDSEEVFIDDVYWSNSIEDSLSLEHMSIGSFECLHSNEYVKSERFGSYDGIDWEHLIVSDDHIEEEYTKNSSAENHGDNAIKDSRNDEIIYEEISCFENEDTYSIGGDIHYNRESLVPAPLEDMLQSVTTPSDKRNQIQTTYFCRQSESIGHRITGRTPTFIHFQQNPETRKITIASLAVAVEKMCFTTECGTLVLCNTAEGYIIAESILQALKKPHTTYHPFSGYCNENTFDSNSASQDFTILTDYKGSKGMECSEAIVFIEKEAANKQQYFLEMISRCTQELFVIFPYSFCQNDPGDMPAALHEVMKTALQNSAMTETIIHLDEIEDAKKDSGMGENNLFIDMHSNEYITKLSVVSNLPAPREAKINHVSPFSRVQNLQYRYEETCSCKLTWSNTPYRYEVRMRTIDSDDWEFVFPTTSVPEIVIDNLCVDEEYLFAVYTVSWLGKSLPAEIQLYHSDFGNSKCSDYEEFYDDVVDDVAVKYENQRKNYQSIQQMREGIYHSYIEEANWNESENLSDQSAVLYDDPQELLKLQQKAQVQVILAEINTKNKVALKHGKTKITYKARMLIDSESRVVLDKSVTVKEQQKCYDSRVIILEDKVIFFKRTKHKKLELLSINKKPPVLSLVNRSLIVQYNPTNLKSLFIGSSTIEGNFLYECVFGTMEGRLQFQIALNSAVKNANPPDIDSEIY